jgi:hypothetical protein
VDKFTLSDELSSQLTGESGSAELYDKDGRTVGYFVPPAEYKKLVYAWAREEFARDEREHPYDDNDEGSMTTPELLAYLNQLGRRESGAA